MGSVPPGAHNIECSGRRGTGTFGTTNQNEVTDGSLSSSITSLVAASEYMVQVIAVNAGGAGTPSEPATKRPLPTEVVLAWQRLPTPTRGSSR